MYIAGLLYKMHACTWQYAGVFVGKMLGRKRRAVVALTPAVSLQTGRPAARNCGWARFHIRGWLVCTACLSWAGRLLAGHRTAQAADVHLCLLCPAAQTFLYSNCGIGCMLLMIKSFCGCSVGVNDHMTVWQPCQMPWMQQRQLIVSVCMCCHHVSQQHTLHRWQSSLLTSRDSKDPAPG